MIAHSISLRSQQKPKRGQILRELMILKNAETFSVTLFFVVEVQTCCDDDDGFTEKRDLAARRGPTRVDRLRSFKYHVQHQYTNYKEFFAINFASDDRRRWHVVTHHPTHRDVNTAEKKHW